MIWSRDYRPHSAYIATVQPSAGGVLALAGGLALVWYVSQTTISLLFPPLEPGQIPATTGPSRFMLILLLLSNAAPVLALASYLRRFHHRSGWTLFGPLGQCVAQFRAAAVVIGLVVLVRLFLPPWISGDDLVRVNPVAAWLLTLPLVGFAILIQSGAEELIFRGYLQQELAAKYQNPLVWMLIPSVIFGLIHWGSADGLAENVLWVGWAMLLGLACADLTARTGTIGPAIALHWLNNCEAMLIFGEDTEIFSSMSLLIYPYSDPSLVDHSLSQLLSPWGQYQIIASTLSLLALWLAARIGLRR